ncbi:beta-galactosidase [Parastagonospora nodorum]|nr:beta-galactosidase [Parastagonospora nodorum]KAH3985664.1 beta-galactosidase [Parastagonospora nodorum]KAH4003655.1 beta-galactosidase [Parastagonospora nodorum]KAH4029269.1 beta-galactosidase [Parastagonospora nodorum]KAH4038167.1 beta-galactosidase [Parastagonospora nodorum]
MRTFQGFSWLSALSILATVPESVTVNAQNGTIGQWPLHDNGLNQVVQWDHYSFKVNGKRLFVFSGEIHYWRIPVPEVWEDLLEKIKAAGFTAFAFYGNWGYHSANNRTTDFETGAHDFTKLFEIAQRVGLYVITRPGPYVNAEANAGGFPLWLTTGAYGSLRNNDSRYLDALDPYFSRFTSLTSEHQVTKGGNALVYQIENEYGEQWKDRAEKIPNTAAGQYMAALEDSARANGIDTPLIHNDPNMNTRSWSKDYAPGAVGNVDVAGLDSYPSCWSCNLDECTGTNGKYVAYQVIDYYDHFVEVAPTQPSFFPEFQGGSYNPWGGPEGGCPADIGADFANLFYRNLIAQRVTAVSLYMMYGGTNWGAFAAPVVATSYDYSSPISENRKIDSKFYETKNLAMFTRVAHDLTVTDRLGNNTGYTTNPAVEASELRNPETKAAFYVTIHSQSSSATVESFKLHVSTSVGNLTIPQHGGSIVLNGHQSKILVTDFAMGSQTLVYSTAEVLTYAVIDTRPVMVLSAGTGESVEFHIKGAKKGSIISTGSNVNATFYNEAGGTTTNIRSVSGMSVYQFDNGVKVIVADKPTAYLFWAPNLSNDPFAPVDQSVLVSGPYLVRSVSYSDGILALKGDILNTTTVEVFACASAETLSWNGNKLQTSRTTHGSLKATVAAYNGTIEIPPLDDWKVHDTLPEKLPGYNDSGAAWVVADHLTTPNPTTPDTLPVLYVDEYGFHNSFHLFRGYFDGSASGVKLAVQGGQAFGWSAWLNGDYLGSYLGNSSVGTGNMTLSFVNATVNTNGTNVLLVAQDNTGHDLRADAIKPRGILGAMLDGGSFSQWKIAGEAGGENVQLDPVRGTLSEGGLTAERLGWHLPGFDDSAWNSSSPSTGFEEAGIYFYRTVIPLNVPAELDAAFAFVLNASGSQHVRVQLFVNGYQYARFNPHVGNEKKFPVPPGVLNYGGDNVIGLSVWAQSEEGAKIDVQMVQEYAVESSWSSRFDSEYLRPGWTEARLAYA